MAGPLTSRDDYKRLKIYADALAAGKIQWEQIPDKWQVYIPQRDQLRQKREHNSQAIENEKLRYDSSSTGKAMTALGGLISATMSIPAISIAGSTIVGNGATEGAINYALPAAKGELAKRAALQLLTSTTGGETVNEISKLLTHKSFGENLYDNTLGHLHQGASTDRMRNFGSRLFDFVNPGYLLSPNIVYKGMNFVSPVLSSNRYMPLYRRFQKFRKAYDINRNDQALRADALNEEVFHTIWDPIATDTKMKAFRSLRQGPQPTSPKDARSTIIYPFRSKDPLFVTNKLKQYSFYGPSTSRLDPSLNLSQKIDGIQFTLPNTNISSTSDGMRIFPIVKDGKVVKLQVGQSNLGESAYVTLPNQVVNYITSKNNNILAKLNPNHINGIKGLGSTQLAMDRSLPTIADDFDFIVTQDFADKNLNKFTIDNSHSVRFGRRIIVDGQPVDINIIQSGPDGNARGELAEQLFAKYFPEEYWHAVQNINYGLEPIKINKTPQELLDAHSPVRGTILDTFISPKDKHISRVPIILEQGNPNMIQEVLNTRGKMYFGTGYKDWSRSMNFTNVDDNLAFLQLTGYPHINAKELASNPQRMKLVVEDFLQGISGTGRGTRQFFDAPFYEWQNRTQSGIGRGALLNTVKLENSGYGPYYQFSQLDFGNTFDGKSPLEVVNLLRTLSRTSTEPIAAEFMKGVPDVLNKYHLGTANTARDLNTVLSDAYEKLSPDVFDKFSSDLRNTSLPGLFSDEQFVGANKLLRSPLPSRFSAASTIGDHMFDIVKNPISRSVLSSQPLKLNPEQMTIIKNPMMFSERKLVNTSDQPMTSRPIVSQLFNTDIKKWNYWMQLKHRLQALGLDINNKSTVHDILHQYLGIKADQYYQSKEFDDKRLKAYDVFYNRRDGIWTTYNSIEHNRKVLDDIKDGLKWLGITAAGTVTGLSYPIITIYRKRKKDLSQNTDSLHINKKRNPNHKLNQNFKYNETNN